MVRKKAVFWTIDLNCQLSFKRKNHSKITPVVENNTINAALQAACLKITQNIEFFKIVSQKYDLYYDSGTNQYYCRVMTTYQTQTGEYGADITLHRVEQGETR